MICMGLMMRSNAKRKCNSEAKEGVPEKIKKLCDLAKEATCVVDSNGLIVYFNKFFESLYGMDIENLLHTHVLDNPLRNKFNTDGSILATNSVALDSILYRSPVQHFGFYNNRTHILMVAFPYFDPDSGKNYIFCQHSPIDEFRKALIENYQYALRDNRLAVNEGVSEFPTSIIAVDAGMKNLLKLLRKAAKSDSSILLRGETGTGKEVMARGIHAVSKRCDGPFIPVNCGAIPSELFEAEFFGYEKGAFTSAVQARAGYFELANYGTIFLDEIGDLPLNFQVKLLRVLQEKECTRIGGKKPIKLNFRVISATNKNIELAVENALFRADLYYRLNVITATIPPLRARKQDILPLAKSFTDFFNHKENLNKRLSNAACKSLLRYNWPGNVRELRNVIERSIVLSTSDIIEEINFGASREKVEPTFEEKMDLATLVSLYENEIIKKRIENCGSIRKASQSLGVNHATLLRKMKKANETEERIHPGLTEDSDQ